MKKTIMFILMLAVCLLVVPSVYADDVEYPKVTDATKDDSLEYGEKPVVEGSGTDTVTVKVNGGSFQLLDDGSDEGVTRPEGYTWIGLHFVMPEGTQESEIKFGTGEHDTAYKNEGFDEYFGFNDEDLKNAAKTGDKLTQTYTLTWKDKNSEEQTQTIKIVIDLEKVFVTKLDESGYAWSEDIYHHEIGDIKVSLHINCPSEVGDDYNKYLYIPANSKLAEKDVRALASLKEYIGTKYVIEGFYSENTMKTKFDFSKALAEDTTVFIKLTAAKKETNPATGDNLLTYVSLSTIALIGALGTGLYLKKVNE